MTRDQELRRLAKNAWLEIPGRRPKELEFVDRFIPYIATINRVRMRTPVLETYTCVDIRTRTGRPVIVSDWD